MRLAKLRTGVLGVQVVDLHEAEVRVEIAAPLLDRRFVGVEVMVKSDRFATEPSAVNIRLKGPLDTLNGLVPKDLQAVVGQEFLAQRPVKSYPCGSKVCRRVWCVWVSCPTVRLIKRKMKVGGKEKP